MNCNRCQSPASEGAVFCEECGARLESACPSCGAEAGPSARFCRNCGSPLQADGRAPAAFTPAHLATKILASRASLEGERKQVTALFADLRGSMELLESVDPEEARRLMTCGARDGCGPLHEGTVNHVWWASSLFEAPLRTKRAEVASAASLSRFHLATEQVRLWEEQIRAARGTRR
jgi:hypothetical protein